MSIYSCSETVGPTFQENFSILRRPFPAFSAKQHRICVYSTPTKSNSPLPPPSTLTHPAVADWKEIDIFLILRRGRKGGGLLPGVAPPSSHQRQLSIYFSQNKNNKPFIEQVAGMFPSSPRFRMTWLSGGGARWNACCESRRASV